MGRKTSNDLKMNQNIEVKDHYITFQGGRPDCQHSPKEVKEHEFPNPNMDFTAMMDWFKNNKAGFDMNEQQVTLSKI